MVVFAEYAVFCLVVFTARWYNVWFVVDGGWWDWWFWWFECCGCWALVVCVLGVRGCFWMMPVGFGFLPCGLCVCGFGMFGEFGGLGVIRGCGFGFGMVDGIVRFVVLDWWFGVGCLDVLWGLLLWFARCYRFGGWLSRLWVCDLITLFGGCWDLFGVVLL